MSDHSSSHPTALWAMKAVTAGALMFAGVSCSADDGGDSGDPSFNVEEPTGDAGDDTSGIVAPDTGIDCNDEESNDICPDHCTIEDDIDCCEQIDGCWSAGECWEGGCGIEGPYVPPEMTT